MVTPSVGDMERAWVLGSWRTLYCFACRRERRHYTGAHGEVCSWCGTERDQERQPEYDTSARQSASSWNAAS